jgi:hypothetical protein
MGRYGGLGLLAGAALDAGVFATTGQPPVAALQLAFAGLLAAAWVCLVFWRGGRGWEAALLFGAAGLVVLSALGGDAVVLVAMAPLPWLGLRPLRFPGRAALAFLHVACSVALLRLVFLPSDGPVVALPVLFLLLGGFLLWWLRLETTAARRRLLRVAAQVAVGLATGWTLAASGLLGGNPVLASALTVPAALLAPRLRRLGRRYSRRSMNKGSTSGEPA